MTRTRQQAEALVREFLELIKPIYGARLHGVYLFGSHARGEARQDSDIDVAVVLEGDFEAWTERDKISQLRADLCLRESVVMQVLFISLENFAAGARPIDVSIRREGVLL